MLTQMPFSVLRRRLRKRAFDAPPYLHRQHLQTGQGPEPCLSPHRPRRRKPRLHPLPHDRYRHEEGPCEDAGGETVRLFFI